MMSVSPGMGACQAGGYFSREDYYLKGDEEGGNSRWCGKGARALGLDGPVGEEEFRRLCRGEDSSGLRIVSFKLTRDKETGELIETHRAGNDCTFSPTKTVSIAYCARVPGIKEAHDAAVLSVLGHMEEHNCHYRSSGGIQNGKLVAAKFDHATSRNVDPQLHSHVFILNAVQAEDGSWKANEPKTIFQDQKSLGLLYRQELARELQVRGFEITVEDRSQMLVELKPIDPQPRWRKGAPMSTLIPLAYARKLAKELGGEVWTGITNISGMLDDSELPGKRRGLSLAERLRNVQVFLGVLPPESSIIIVADDTLTVGGDLCLPHRSARGNAPRFATTLAVGRSERQKSVQNSSSTNLDTRPKVSPGPKSGPTFSTEEEKLMERERAFLQQKADEALEKMEALEREANPR